MSSASPALLLSDEDRARVAEFQRLVAEGKQSPEQLIAHLEDPSWAVRREVAFVLAELGDAAVPAMCAALTGPRDHEGRLAAVVESLVASRGNPDLALIVLTTSLTPAVICDGAQVLGRRRSVAGIPALVALVDHADDNVSIAALEALGRIGGDRPVERLIAALGSNSFFRVFAAIDGLGTLGDPRATPALLAQLSAPRLTLAVARSLGRLGDGRAVEGLVDLLANPADAIVRTAATSLWAIHLQRFEGTPSADLRPTSGWKPSDQEASARRLIHACKGAERSEQIAICHVLGWFATNEALVALLGFLNTEGPLAEAARSALAALRATIDSRLSSPLRTGDSARRALLLPLVGRPASRPEVEICLTDADPSVCAAACSALARLGDPTAVPALFELLGDRNPQVSHAAVRAILSLGSNETERLALKATQSKNPEERRSGVRIVSTLGYESGLPALLAAIEDDDERLRDIALPGLALLEAPGALEALLAAATHPSVRTRIAAVRALGLAPADPRVGAALRVSLAATDPWIRYHACHALGHRKDVESVDLLVARLDDDAPQVQLAAIEALSHLPGEVPGRKLRALASAADPDMRRAALTGLGLRGEAEALPTLLEASRAGDAATRLVALSALVAFRQPEAIEALALAANDPDDGIRAAAIATLAIVPGLAAGHALVGLVSGRFSRTRALVALASPLDGRVPALFEALELAGESLAGTLAAALSGIQKLDADMALVKTLASANVAARRAVASALGRVHSVHARAALADSAAHDPDLEVRRLATLTLVG